MDSGHSMQFSPDSGAIGVLTSGCLQGAAASAAVRMLCALCCRVPS